MKLENGKLVLESRPCWRCDETGTQFENRVCPRMNRPQNRKRCPHCGSTNKNSHSYCVPTNQIVDCHTCNGTGAVMEDVTDYMPATLWQSFEFRVHRDTRPQTWNEAHLGRGCVYSSTDYGQAWQTTDTEVIAAVRASTSHQACKVFDDNGNPADYVGIFVTENGYSIRAVFDLVATRAEIATEPSVAAGRIIGQKVAEAGGHGTMAAAGKY